MATVSQIGLLSDHRTMHLVAAELAFLTTVSGIALSFDERTVIFDGSCGDFDERTLIFDDSSGDWTASGSQGLPLVDEKTPTV